MQLQVLLGVFVVGVAYLLSVGPIAQPPEYMQFIDNRAFLGIPNFADVMSNLAFVLVGFWGLTSCRNVPLPSSLAARYQFFFYSMFFVAAGSAYFHWQPDLTRLVFDRLPMTLAFTTLVSLIASEVINDKLGERLWWPLMIFGVVSILWWYWTELSGRGDLRAYLFVQFGAMLFILLLLVLFRPCQDIAGPLVSLILLYGLAKTAELLDKRIYVWTGMISGHTLKHLLAALAVWPVVRLATRPRADDARSGVHKGQ